MRALLMLLQTPRKVVEAEQFSKGLQACGYDVHARAFKPDDGDLLVVWNRMGVHHSTAREFEQRHAKVIVAENGYLGATWRGQRWYAMALNHHNGRGKWPDGGPERWDSWGVDLSPRRPLGDTLILAQRGIGEPALRAPERWLDETIRRTRGRVRRHPGVLKTGPTLERELDGVGRVVTWSSGAAIKAMVLGCRCWHGMPGWIAAGCSKPIEAWGRVEQDADDKRLAMFQRLAWAQWSADEVASGEAFRRVLAC